MKVNKFFKSNKLQPTGKKHSQATEHLVDVAVCVAHGKEGQKNVLKGATINQALEVGKYEPILAFSEKKKLMNLFLFRKFCFIPKGKKKKC